VPQTTQKPVEASSAPTSWDFLGKMGTTPEPKQAEVATNSKEEPKSGKQKNRGDKRKGAE